MAKRGRPKKTDDTARSKQFRIRMTQAEYELLKSMSENSNCTLTKTIINALNYYHEHIEEETENDCN